MRYHSPSLGNMEFGWSAPLTIEGREVAIAGYPRFDNPYSQTAFTASQMIIKDKKEMLILDFKTGKRWVKPAVAKK